MQLHLVQTSLPYQMLFMEEERMRKVTNCSSRLYQTWATSATLSCGFYPGGLLMCSVLIGHRCRVSGVGLVIESKL